MLGKILVLAVIVAFLAFFAAFLAFFANMLRNNYREETARQRRWAQLQARREFETNVASIRRLGGYWERDYEAKWLVQHWAFATAPEDPTPPDVKYNPVTQKFEVERE